MSNAFFATCQDCGVVRKVRRFELDRARKPHCLRCGGPLDLSAAGQQDLAGIHDRRRGEGVRCPETDEPIRLIPEREAGRYEFWEWPDLYRWALRDGARRGSDLSALSWREFYGPDGVSRRAVASMAEDAYASALIYASEGRHYESGRPYYKVWPAIATALCDTEMRVEGCHFRLPYPAIEVRLPKRDGPLGPDVGAALVARVEADELGHRDGRDWSLLVVTLAGDLAAFHDRDSCGRYWCADLPVRAGQLLEDSLDQTRLMAEHPDPGSVRSLVRICVGVAFFGLDRHEMILPEVRRKVIDRYLRERRQPTATEAGKILQDARENGLFGFKVGSEISLPTPGIRTHEPDEQGERHELSAGYIRRGHLRMQPVGEGRKDRKLIFVAPTVVRPDLPLRSVHGYRVRADVPARREV